MLKQQKVVFLLQRTETRNAFFTEDILTRPSWEAQEQTVRLII